MVLANLLIEMVIKNYFQVVDLPQIVYCISTDCLITPQSEYILFGCNSIAFSTSIENKLIILPNYSFKIVGIWKFEVDGDLGKTMAPIIYLAGAMDDFTNTPTQNRKSNILILSKTIDWANFHYGFYHYCEGSNFSVLKVSISISVYPIRGFNNFSIKILISGDIQRYLDIMNELEFRTSQ